MQGLKLKLCVSSIMLKVLRSLIVFSQNLRSDFELKFLVEAAKPHNEAISSASKAKLETAVAELQNRIQKKADVDDMEKMLQINQNLKDVRNHIFQVISSYKSFIRHILAGCDM